MIWGLKRTAQQNQPEIADRAVNRMTRFARDNLRAQETQLSKVQESQTANYLWKAINALVGVRGANVVPLLEQTMESKATGWVRGVCLRHIAQLKGVEAVPLVLRKLEDPALKKDAAQALVAIAPHMKPEELIATALKAVEGETHGDILGSICVALVKAGAPDARKALQTIRDRLELWNRAAVEWHLAGLTAEDVLKKLAQTGALKKPLGVDMAARITELWKKSRDAGGLVANAFHHAGTLVPFDLEAGVPLVEHDKLVSEFAKAAHVSMATRWRANSAPFGERRTFSPQPQVSNT